jgi:hypothetical protein
VFHPTGVMPRRDGAGSTLPVGQAGGNSDGDLPMRRFTWSDRHPTAEQALDHAATAGWTVISVKNDWSTVFAPVP